MNIIERFKRLLTDTSIVKEELKLVEHTETSSVKALDISEPILTLVDMILNHELEHNVEQMLEDVGYRYNWVFYLKDRSALHMHTSRDSYLHRNCAEIEGIEITEDEAYFLGDALVKFGKELKQKKEHEQLKVRLANRDKLKELLCGDGK